MFFPFSLILSATSSWSEVRVIAAALKTYLPHLFMAGLLWGIQPWWLCRVLSPSTRNKHRSNKSDWSLLLFTNCGCFRKRESRPCSRCPKRNMKGHKMCRYFKIYSDLSLWSTVFFHLFMHVTVLQIRQSRKKKNVLWWNCSCTHKDHNL